MKCKALIIIIMLYSLTAFSQQPESLSEEESAVDSETSQNVIEEITVLGERTTYSLRLEIKSTEVEVYKMFNELNNNDEFDVTCEEIVYTGSRIPVQTCMAAYLREEEASRTQDFLQSLSGGPLGTPGSGPLLSRDAVAGEVIEKTKAMEQEMIRLAIEYPEFTAALQKLSRLIGVLDARTKN